MISAFGIEHGAEVSKAGPIGAGLARLGARAAQKPGSAIAGAAHESKAAHLGMRDKDASFGGLKLRQNSQPRGLLARKSKNYRQGFAQGAGKANTAGQGAAYRNVPMPSFLR